MAAAVVAALAFGIRSLSVDYLIRVSSMIHGRSPAGSSGRTSRVTLLVRRFFGGQAGVAGFVFVSRMMPRDWQFRRAIAAVFLYGLLFLATLVSRGWPSDVFSGHFSPIHLLPHIMGMLLFSICAVLRYGNDYKGAWIFLLLPSRAIERFALGVYAFLWIDFIVIPNLILLPLLAWRWGIWHAGLFFAYSIAMASAYLALELTLIEEVPFSEQLDPSRGYGLLGAMMAGGLVIAIAVALQYLLIFRSSGIVAITVLTLGVAAYFVTRASVGAFAASMQYHLSLASAAVGPFYSEVR